MEASDSLLTEGFLLQKQKIQDRRTEPISNRRQRLKKLRGWIHNNRTAIQDAVYADFRRNPLETDGIEIFNVLSEIKHALSNLESWAAIKKIDAPITMLGTRSYIYYEPRGVCLIIAPWNYPFLLCVGPLVSALAAGNAVVLKPSELTPHVSAVVKRMSDELFDPAVVTTVEGGVDATQQLLKLPFDHIFFTGSPTVGKIVMKEAAENLTSVTLELGGKSPALITNSAILKDVANRTAAAKFVNNGQTCIAPDYVLVDEKIQDQFIHELIEQTKKLFTEKNETFETSAHYCRIINDKNFDRLNALLQDAVAQGAQVKFGGSINAETRFIHPTILSAVPHSSKIMEEEIFGPILPVIGYKTLDEAIAIVNKKSKPLALYIFSSSKREQEKILSHTSAGGVCINDSAIHFFNSNLPFGGVNASGIGKAHGYHGFLAFSN
jgi:aldehyde dehydrogenase (NAD+)